MLDFPNNPTNGQSFTNSGITRVWDGVKWESSSGAEFYLLLSGGTLTGPLVLQSDPGLPLGAATKQYVDNNFLLLTGGTLTGLLTLSGPPTANLHAATKQYVDSHLPVGGPFLPLSGGTLTGLLTLSGPPTALLHAATKQYVDSQLPVGGPFLPLSGGTLTGLLTLSGPPTANLHAATKQYVDSQLPVGGPFLPLTGGTLTGLLTLSGPPTANLHAATKQYVDNSIINITAFLPLSGGTLTGPLALPLGTVTINSLQIGASSGTGLYGIGSNSIAVAINGVARVTVSATTVTATIPILLPADPSLNLQAATKQYVDSHLPVGGPFLPLSGGTMTGLLTLSGPPTANNHAATKLYVDQAVAGIGSGAGFVNIGDTPPASPTVGAEWWDSKGGQLYIWYDDGTSRQWVPATTVTPSPAGGPGVFSQGLVGTSLPVQTLTPVDGATVTLTAFGPVLIANNVAYASLTIRMPPSPSLSDFVDVSFLRSVTALHLVDSNGNIISTAPTNANGPGASIILRMSTVGWVYWK